MGKQEFLEHHQDPPRRSINIRVHRNGTKVAVPITLTINLQLYRSRVLARRFALRRAKPKVPATQVNTLRPQPRLEDDGQAESVSRQLQDLGVTDPVLYSTPVQNHMVADPVLPKTLPQLNLS